jgi:hypothetical protein
MATDCYGPIKRSITGSITGFESGAVRVEVGYHTVMIKSFLITRSITRSITDLITGH